MAVAAGMGAMTAEVAEAADGDVPFTFVARTVERTVWPPSALVSWYVFAVALGMLAQPAPVDEQRCHW